MRNNNNQYLHIFLDSRSIDNGLSKSDPYVRRCLSYSSTVTFRFIRSPYHTKHKSLNKIHYFEVEKDTDTNSITEIKIRDDGDRETHVLFSAGINEVEEFAKIALGKDLPTEEEKEAILLVLIHRDFILGGFYSDESIFVTKNKKLVTNRVWFQSRFFPKFEIMTVEEAMGIMDLFAKAHGHYYLRPHVTADKRGWYWSSFRSKVPHYHVLNRGPFEQRHILEAFASRFTYLLLSIDEIGMHCLWLKDKDIMIPYHFNYFISLTTGILDSLAITTKERYQIKLKHDHPSRTSLSNSTGREFLRELKKQNPNLRSHIDSYREFINLIYELREVSIHRQGFSDIGYTQNIRFTWFFKINDNIESLIKLCGDKLPYNASLSNWGITKHPIFTLLEPYHFVKAAGSKLVALSDGYLRLLGFNKFIDTEFRMFEQYSLMT
jgi:hypothetical protein